MEAEGSAGSWALSRTKRHRVRDGVEYIYVYVGDRWGKMEYWGEVGRDEPRTTAVRRYCYQKSRLCTRRVRLRKLSDLTTDIWKVGHSTVQVSYSILKKKTKYFCFDTNVGVYSTYSQHRLLCPVDRTTNGRRVGLSRSPERSYQLEPYEVPHDRWSFSRSSLKHRPLHFLYDRLFYFILASLAKHRLK